MNSLTAKSGVYGRWEPFVSLCVIGLGSLCLRKLQLISGSVTQGGVLLSATVNSLFVYAGSHVGQAEGDQPPYYRAIFTLAGFATGIIAAPYAASKFLGSQAAFLTTGIAARIATFHLVAKITTHVSLNALDGFRLQQLAADFRGNSSKWESLHIPQEILTLYQSEIPLQKEREYTREELALIGQKEINDEVLGSDVKVTWIYTFMKVTGEFPTDLSEESRRHAFIRKCYDLELPFLEVFQSAMSNEFDVTPLLSNLSGLKGAKVEYLYFLYSSNVSKWAELDSNQKLHLNEIFTKHGKSPIVEKPPLIRPFTSLLCKKTIPTAVAVSTVVLLGTGAMWYISQSFGKEGEPDRPSEVLPMTPTFEHIVTSVFGFLHNVQEGGLSVCSVNSSGLQVTLPQVPIPSLEKIFTTTAPAVYLLVEKFLRTVEPNGSDVQNQCHSQGNSVSALTSPFSTPGMSSTYGVCSSHGVCSTQEASQLFNTAEPQSPNSPFEGSLNSSQINSSLQHDIDKPAGQLGKPDLQRDFSVTSFNNIAVGGPSALNNGGKVFVVAGSLLLAGVINVIAACYRKYRMSGADREKEESGERPSSSSSSTFSAGPEATGFDLERCLKIYEEGDAPVRDRSFWHKIRFKFSSVVFSWNSGLYWECMNTLKSREQQPIRCLEIVGDGATSINDLSDCLREDLNPDDHIIAIRLKGFELKKEAAPQLLERLKQKFPNIAYLDVRGNVEESTDIDPNWMISLGKRNNEKEKTELLEQFLNDLSTAVDGKNLQSFIEDVKGRDLGAFLGPARFFMTKLVLPKSITDEQMAGLAPNLKSWFPNLKCFDISKCDALTAGSLGGIRCPDIRIALVCAAFDKVCVTNPESDFKTVLWQWIGRLNLEEKKKVNTLRFHKFTRSEVFDSMLPGSDGKYFPESIRSHLLSEFSNLNSVNVSECEHLKLKHLKMFDSLKMKKLEMKNCEGLQREIDNNLQSSIEADSKESAVYLLRKLHAEHLDLRGSLRFPGQSTRDLDQGAEALRDRKLNFLMKTWLERTYRDGSGRKALLMDEGGHTLEIPTQKGSR